MNILGLAKASGDPAMALHSCRSMSSFRTADTLWSPGGKLAVARKLQKSMFDFFAKFFVVCEAVGNGEREKFINTLNKCSSLPRKDYFVKNILKL